MNSNSNTDLYGVWGTSASSVWAVGDGGAILYYNGAIWQTRSSPVTEVIVSIHGSAPDNIAALAFSDGYDSQLDVLRYDGTSWTKLGSVNNTYYANTSCLFTYGPNDVFVYSTYWDIAGQASKGQLHRIKNGVVTQLLANGPVSGESGCGLWVFSPTNVLIGAIDVQKWDGTQLTAVGSGSPYSNGLFAFSPTSVFAKGNPPTYWDGQSWSNLTTAFQGTVTGLHGTSASRIFASAYYYSGATQSDFGAALFYDGLGWTQEALPSGTLSLNGIWAAPTGEVFAVGNHGTIVKGP
jgi:hypothetical protein